MSMEEERRRGQKQLEDVKQKLEEKGSQIDTMLVGDDSGEGDSSPTPMDPVNDSYEGQVVDLQQYTPLGGVFYCDVFRLPPQSQQLNGWEMRAVGHRAAAVPLPHGAVPDPGLCLHEAGGQWGPDLSPCRGHSHPA